MTLYKATPNGNIPLTQEEENELNILRQLNNSLQDKKDRLIKSIGEIRIARTDGHIKIANSLNFITRNPARAIPWKSDSGFVQLNKQEMDEMVDSIGEIVAQCYEAEKQHIDMINALTESNIDTYDIDQFWP